MLRFNLFLFALLLCSFEAFSQTYDQNVNATTDDAIETNGVIDNNNQDDFFGLSSSSTWNGMRFNGVTIPSGAIITSAYVEVEADRNESGSTSSVTIFAEASANAANFSATNITSRSKTTASKNWILPNFLANVRYQSPDISNIIQELLDGQNGLTNASIAMLLQGTGNDNRVIKNIEDGGASNASRLVINWTTTEVCSYKDNFATPSYTHSTGTQDWSASPWIEVNDGNNGASGNTQCFQTNYVIYVAEPGDCTYGFCPEGNCLTFNLIGVGNGDYIYRQMDLSGATTANLSFNYAGNLFGSDNLQLQIRTGNGTWNTLATYTNLTNSGTANINIDAHIATDTEIRFIQNGASGGTFAIDDINVTYDCVVPNPGVSFPIADHLISSGGTVNSCNGVFADNGDTNGNYGDNLNHTQTICSDENNHISFTFEHFNTEAGADILSIYNGSNTDNANLIGNYSGFGEANSPGVVTSTGKCLTFRFQTNGSVNSTGWLARISCTGLPIVTSTTPNWTGYPTTANCGSAAQIGGTVYEDNDNDGVQDAREVGIYNVAVSIFDENGLVNTTTTDANGEYTFNALNSATTYRVEFVVPDGLTEGAYGTNSGTAVQFVDGGSCNVNLALADVAHYCDDTNPFFIIPCYFNGDPQHADNVGATAVARFKYGDSGNSPTASYTNYVTAEAVGTIWGVTNDATADKIYMSSVLKRHVGLGPNGIGAIYAHTAGAANNSASLLYDFGALAGTVASNATRFPGTGTVFGDEGPCSACSNIDATTFSQVGKAGFGDIDVNPQNGKLYVTNLFDRKIYTIDPANPTAGSATPLPGIPWLDNSPCNNGVARPWALEFRRGKVYVGVVCDASLSSCAIGTPCDDLTAIVYSFDGATWTNELQFPLNYYREAYVKGSDYLVKWVDDWSVMEPFVSNRVDANFGQPILMDIEFDDDNSIILGFGDRSGLQMGYKSPPPVGPHESTAEVDFAYGDILRASYNPTTNSYSLENNGIVGGLTTTNPTNLTGPGGKSFYHGDYWYGIGADRYQAGIGALMLLPNSGEVATPLGDAMDYYTNGITWMSNTNGDDVKRLEVYQGAPDGSIGNFAKGTGVGDMDLLCGNRPLEIGNIVWWDEDLDGLQDPNEPGIANVTLELWLDANGSAVSNMPLDGSGVKIATTTTDAYGRYIFSFNGNNNGLNAENWSFTSTKAIEANTNYQVRIPNWATDAGLIAYRNSLGYSGHLIAPTQNQTDAIAAGGTERDNNAYDDSNHAAATITTRYYGDNDHNVDFAFGGVGGCEAPEAIPTANIPCEGGDINLMTSVSGAMTPYVYNWSGPNSFTSTAANPSINHVEQALHPGIYYLSVTDATGCIDTTHIHITINNTTVSAMATDATCGASDASIALDVTGVAPFLYEWDNDGVGDNDDTEDLANIPAGAYNVTVTDGDGCMAISAAAVADNGAAILTETHQDESCNSNNGSIDLTIGGAFTSILWSNGATSEDLNGLSAGTYSVTVTNSIGCTASLSVILTNTFPPTATATTVDATCEAPNGSANVVANGGLAPYTYNWLSNTNQQLSTTENVMDLAAGQYLYIVTDANGCTAIDLITINSSLAAKGEIIPTNETCGNSNGALQVNVSQGVAPYEYLWNNGLTTANIDGLSAGTYEVTVTASDGCTFVATETIINIEGPTIDIAVTDAKDCLTSDGALDLTVMGGTPGYQYDWDIDGLGDNDDTEDLSNLAAGAYAVLVTDANGCQVSQSIGVGKTDDPALEFNVTDPAFCGDVGAIDLNINGPNAPYTIDWSNDGVGDNDDMEDLADLEGGVYEVSITDAIGCSVQASASIKVIRPPAIMATVTPSLCGTNPGAVEVSISDIDAGANPTYMIDWDNDGVGDFDDPQSIIELAAGNYSVTVINNINCITTETFNVADIGAPTVTYLQTNPSCSQANGAIDIMISDGTPAYTYNWSNGATTQDLINLNNGQYNVTVTDANGCKTPVSATLASFAPATIDAFVTNEDCTDGKGAVNLLITGAGPFLIDWDIDGVGDNDDMQNLTNLSAGTYTVMVTDLNGCTTTEAVTVLDVCIVEVGNFIWNDTNRDGIQDPGEMGIAGVVVELVDDMNNVIATAITDSNGAFLFTNATGTSTANNQYGLTDLTANANYSLSIANAVGANQQTPLSGLELSPINATTDDLDSDATLSGDNAIAPILTPNGGTVNAGFGFSTPPCMLTITATPDLICQNNGTPTIDTDDYFTILLNATAVDGGASNQYEVVLNANPDGSGGTILGMSTYGTAITLGNGINGATSTFLADNATTYTLTVRDADSDACFDTFTTTPVMECSDCPAPVCPPVGIQINPAMGN